MWWDVVMYDWNLDENSLSKWRFLQHCQSQMSKKVPQRTEKDVMLTINVGDTKYNM